MIATRLKSLVNSANIDQQMYITANLMVAMYIYGESNSLVYFSDCNHPIR